ncbi:surface attachment protein Sap1 [Paraburkholderia sp.]|uniref:surface attachment protein Sap1 n=1 Tax=Paraburkholderia sp. TaxID=1926495 RepID=UPI003D6FFFA7
MIKRIALLFAVAGFAVASAVQAQDVVVKPLQTIQFKPNAYGCLSKDNLDAVNQHAQAGEQQKMQEFFSGYQCLSTPENASFRVVRVVGHDIEFVNSGNSDTQGLWTNDRFIKP